MPAHNLFGDVPWVVTDLFFAVFWMFPATYLPFLLAVFDANHARVVRFSLIYLATFFLLGNVMAGLFMSGGPIYYDRLVGGNAFADLVAIFESGARGETLTSNLQGLLWTAYAEGEQKFGSGISAFPSVHVAMTALWALYLVEVSRKLLPLSIALVLIYQVFSVFLGWHYAVDGYALILVILALWALTRKSGQETNVATQLTPT